MSEAKFTPGPWVSNYEKGGLSGEFNLMAGTKVIVGGCGCCESPYMQGDDPAADSHLIAAAPELYDVLEKVLADYDSCKYCMDEMKGDWVGEARNALAKARGEV